MRSILLGFMTLISAFAYAEAPTKVYNLENGLKLIVREDKRAPVVVTQIWYKVGSSYEPVGLTGVSHALEHMMFKGTEAYPEGEFSRLISANGGEQNAFTYYDFTAYYQKLRSNLLPLSFKLEADRMQNIIFNEAPLKKEMNVVANERLWRTEDKPERLAEERFLAAAYLGNPYQHPVIGWMGDIQSYTLEDLREWYETWYAPNNAIVVVVGAVNGDDVYKLAQEYFANLPKRDLPKVRITKLLPPFGRRQVDVKLSTNVPKLFMGYNVPSVNVAENPDDAYALEVLAYILDGGKSARLEKALIRQQQIAVSVQTSYPLYSLHPTLFQLTVTPSPKHTLNELEAAVLAELERVKSESIDSKEFERVKTNVIANHLYSKDSMFYQAYEIGALEVLGLPWKEGDQYVEKILAITPKQVQEVAKKYFTDDRLTITFLTSDSAEDKGAQS